MKILTTNTDGKNMRNNGPHTITSTQVFSQSVTINGIVSKPMYRINKSTLSTEQ